MLIFIAAFGFIYPFIGYIKQKIELNRSFAEDKQEVIQLFSAAGFVLEKDENNKLVFRNRSILSRVLRLGEDGVEIDYSDNPIVVSGLRRDAYRLARMVQHYVRNIG